MLILLSFNASGMVQNVLVLPQLHIHTRILRSFLMKLFRQVIFYGLEIAVGARRILNEEMAFGVQTDVHIYSARLGLTFIWCHKLRRPLGISIGIQCPSCGRLEPFDVSIDPLARHATISCRGCGKSDVHLKPNVRHLDLMVRQTGCGWAVDVLWGLLPDSLRH